VCIAWSKAKILLLSILVVMATPPVNAEHICSVHDGDTFTICDGRRVRVAGIDAPEIDQPFGIESRNYLRSLIQDQDVKLECDGSKSYSRIVCTPYVSIESLMVRAGFAFDYPHYSHGFYAKNEEEAKTRRLGVGSQPGGGERPWDHRHKDKRINNK